MPTWREKALIGGLWVVVSVFLSQFSNFWAFGNNLGQLVLTDFFSQRFFDWLLAF